jgi:hypothetical protein
MHGCAWPPYAMLQVMNSAAADNYSVWNFIVHVDRTLLRENLS